MDEIRVQGIVLKASDYSEYDKRLTLLTRESGKITVFAHGARKSGSRFLAASEPFTYGNFDLLPGKSAYNLSKVEIVNYFEGIRTDFEAFLMGEYFLEIADYYTWENNDDFEMLKLLYQGLRALISPSFPNGLVRGIFEIKAIQVNGEFPGLQEKDTLLPGTRRAVDYILKAPPEKVFSFVLDQASLNEFISLADGFRARCIGQNFKSLEVMRDIGV